jgi:hypothetical protein
MVSSEWKGGTAATFLPHAAGEPPTPFTIHHSPFTIH